MTKKIIINKPYIISGQKGKRLCADVSYDGQNETYWFEVSEEYAGYLTRDRLDAFVVAFIYKAMNTASDIICEAPVSKCLLEKINGRLIPALAENMETFHKIHIEAEGIAAVKSCEGAVVTGWTGGVDSTYTLYKYLEAEDPRRRLTHLLITNNGALESDHNEELLDFLVKRAEDGIAKDTGLKVIGVNSNLEKIPGETYLAVAGYRLPAVVLALQELFSVFYNSACYPASRFYYAVEDSAYYETLLMESFSTETMRMYSSGSEVSRLRKLEKLSDYAYARKYLHPCIYASAKKNCGKCGKCIRTEAALYALGMLQRFDKVFDIREFEDSKDRYIADVIFNKRILDYGEVYMLLKEKGLITKRAAELARIRKAAGKVADRNKEDIIKLIKQRGLPS